MGENGIKQLGNNKKQVLNPFMFDGYLFEWLDFQSFYFNKSVQLL